MKLIALGEGTSYEFFSASGLFDEVIQLSSTSETNFPEPIKDIFNKANYVLSIADFDFAQRMKSFGKKVIFIDPLYWMWDKDPIPMSYCHLYYVLDFPGVEQRVKDHSKKFPNDLSPIIVNPICINMDVPNLDSLVQKKALLVNFGGIQSPLGSNLLLIQAMSNLIIDVVSEFPDLAIIYICGSDYPTTQFAQIINVTDKRVWIGSLSQPEFLRQLAICQSFMTVPGLSIVYEAICLRKETLFLLPLNYSQHLQGQIYRRILQGGEFVMWDDLPGYAMLPANLPEENGVTFALELGQRFYADSYAHEVFKKKIRGFLLRKTGQALRLTGWTNRNGEVAFDGATYIAEDVLFHQ